MTKENINSECTLNQAMEMGLTEEEFELICQKIGKIPNLYVRQPADVSIDFDNFLLGPKIVRSPA